MPNIGETQIQLLTLSPATSDQDGLMTAAQAALLAELETTTDELAETLAGFSAESETFTQAQYDELLATLD